MNGSHANVIGLIQKLYVKLVKMDAVSFGRRLETKKKRGDYLSHKLNVFWQTNKALSKRKATCWPNWFSLWKTTVLLTAKLRENYLRTSWDRLFVHARKYISRRLWGIWKNRRLFGICFHDNREIIPSLENWISTVLLCTSDESIARVWSKIIEWYCVYRFDNVFNNHTALVKNLLENFKKNRFLEIFPDENF